jgi:hypothetical protein
LTGWISFGRKRQEKARLEQARIDNIKNEIDTISMEICI